MTEEMRRKRYRAFMRTRGGMYAQYSGHIEFWSDGEDLLRDAVRELRRGAFPDYSSDMWKLERCEVLP